MNTEIVLPVGANAEPDTCGSCKFFKRRDEMYSAAHGFCMFVVPQKVATRHDLRNADPKQQDREYTGNEDQIKDTSRCDLYHFSGKTYIVQRRI